MKKYIVFTLFFGIMISTACAEETGYLILARRTATGNWFYLTSVNANTEYTPHLEAVNSGTTDKSQLVRTNLEDKFIWYKEYSENGFYLKNNEQYISYMGVNTMGMSNNGQLLSETSVSNGLVNYWFIDGNDKKRYLSLNTSQNYFSFYAGTQAQDLLVLEYGEEPVIPQPQSDNYVVLARRNANSNWFYMTSDLGTASNKRYQAVDAGTSSLENVNTSDLESKYYWQIEDTKLHTAAGYSTWTSGNTAILDNTGKDLTIVHQTDGTYTFSFVDGTDTRYLALNATAGNNYFAYYKGTNQIYQLTLIKEGENGTTEDVGELSSQEPAITKILHNGQILILRGDKTYTLTGQEVK